MIYLDYSATTPVNDEVLNTFTTVTRDFIGNPNSLHKLGVNSKKLIDASTNQIADILGVLPSEVIYTSGASESNNTAIKGICLKYSNRGKHIITTNLEHSSVIAPISYLQKQGFEVDFVNLDENGVVDLDSLRGLLRDDTILVSIGSVSSEIGIIQPINEIAKIVKQYPKCFLHVDMTQSIGKQPVNLKDIDLVSLSAQKFYGIKGIGCLIKKENIVIEPLIHGGKSTTAYRSGTPAPALIASLAKALRLATENIIEKYEYVKELNTYLKDNLSKFDNVHINSNEQCIPHILNISVVGVKPETLLHALEEKDIYVSTQTACSSNTSRSAAVYALTNNNDYANSSIRISLSPLTLKEELDIFLDVFETINEKLQIRN